LLSKNRVTAPAAALPAGTGENPKARFGAAKSPLALIPGPFEVGLSEVMALGAKKYGPYNWRETGVEAMTYANAGLRHLRSWIDGEDIDPESGEPHILHVAACMAILVDAQSLGMLDDNRPPKGKTAEFIRDRMKVIA
jgi:hypothetical protein